jgi:hypothetical protein
MGETDWYPNLVQEAHRWGWLVEHHRSVKTSTGRHMTAIMGDIGWPDFTFSHPERGITVFREIKGPRTVVTPTQKRWLASLHRSGLDVDVWRMPADWPKAVALLSFGRAAVTSPML